MRVLHVMECTIGGTRRHLVDLALGQARMGAEVLVVASTLRDPGFPGDLECLRAAGILVRVLDMQRSPKPWLDYRQRGELVAILRELRPDIVHSHSSKAGVLARSASLAAGIGRRVHTPHTFAFLFEALFSPLRRRLYRAIERHYEPCTERFIAVAKSEAETWRRAGIVPEGKIRVVPNGIDAAAFETAEPLDLATLGLDPTRPVLGLIGLVYAAKGQDIAIETLARPEFRELQLLCVGPGDSAPLEAQARRLSISSRVRFCGPRDDVPRILKSLAALVLPSRWEGMPLVVLEAFAASCPVIAHPVDGARDVVRNGETGFLARAISSEALAEALARFLATPTEELRRLTSAARELQRRSHSVEAMVQGTLRVYEELG